MRQIVESFKRLFSFEKIDELKLNELCEKGTITEDEKQYILGKEE